MKPVVVDPEAEAELTAAIAWYESQRPGLGHDLRSEFDTAVQAIEQSPSTSPTYRVGGVRRRRLGKFPYTVYYKELDSETLILAVAHDKRRANYWLHRLP